MGHYVKHKTSAKWGCIKYPSEFQLRSKSDTSDNAITIILTQEVSSNGNDSELYSKGLVSSLGEGT